MDTDMDIDMDIDLGINDPELDPLEAEDMRIENEASTFLRDNAQPFTGVSAPVDPAQVSPEKVHIRGLDNMATSDVKNYVFAHFPSDKFARVEWIDDTSANLVYENAEEAESALAALTDFEGQDPFSMQSLQSLQLRKAKRLPAHPDTELWVRHAILADVKKPRAHEASRFYLLNPDKDPREIRRQNGSRRGAGTHSDERGDYRKRRFDERENRRRQADSRGGFDVSMYDDAPEAETREPSRRRRNSYSGSSSGDDRGRRTARAGNRADDDLFAHKIARSNEGRLRDRSASPAREGDGRMGFDEEFPARRRIRQRSPTPPARRRADLASRVSSNARKELFPRQPKASALDGTVPSKELFLGRATASTELFPNKASPAKRPRELFPNKTDISNHRRTNAFDAADETGDLFANGSPSPYGRLNRRSTPVRTEGNAPDVSEDRGFAVKGVAEKAPGFSIRGAAQIAAAAPAPKELFPLKTGGNAGKELFADRARGGPPRKKAADMFL